jgi:hypothetical protein
MRLLSIFLAFTIFSCAFPMIGKNNNIAKVNEEDYALYNVLITDFMAMRYGNKEFKLIAIQDCTFINLSDDNYDSIVSRVKEIATEEPSIDNTMLESFIRFNRYWVKLENHFAIGHKCELVPRKKLEKIWQDPGWQDYYKEHPGSQGLLEVSRVAYNSSHDKALVYIGNWSRPLAGGGGYAVLEKNGNWRVRKWYHGWIS